MYAIKSLQLLQHCLHDDWRILDPLLMQLPRLLHPTHLPISSGSGMPKWFYNKFAANQNVRRPNWSMLACWVKGWTWITDNLDHLYSCPCGLSCLWTKSYVLVNKHDALLFETTTPPLYLLHFVFLMLCRRFPIIHVIYVCAHFYMFMYSARKAEMEVIRSEFLDRENIQKFWDEKMNVEKTPGLGVEKAYLAALSDLEQE
ncbi:hypothetical protein DVH24_002259 [Malus domestica]|uniref:Uncharacterized protein n=1 Tax=Malus domestica TaxID=3750 RepID=A0A498IB01_MALDO|nr:hypothetical protein DVH24_002259 [Malus domestica]